MKSAFRILGLLICWVSFGCQPTEAPQLERTAADILSDSNSLAFAFGGYRHTSRDTVPTVEDLKEDMLVLHAMGVNLLRTYHASQYPQARRLLQAIKELKAADPAFEMYIMLGAWIQCENAWTANPNHQNGDTENNEAEIQAVIEMAKAYPDIVKIIAVGNEAMVHWAAGYFVLPGEILKYVNQLQTLKQKGELPASLWITSSDNFASWGGESADYHSEDLTALIKAVDFLSVHTYPFHDSHYQPSYWQSPDSEQTWTDEQKIEAAMLRARDRAKQQYLAVKDYIKQLGIEKDIHIGETGWASNSAGFYGDPGSQAADEYKAKRYYDLSREWTREEGISCFYFEAFDEPWKDPNDALGSENHFGMINIQSEAKYALWSMVDEGVFDGLTRNGKPITKTFGGNVEWMMQPVKAPPRDTSTATHLIP